MKKGLVVLGLFISVLSFGQARYEWGEKFAFYPTEESNPQFVLTDNYNTYLLTTINVDGMLPSHKITIRKFDQKNQLVNTYTQDLKKLDIGTLYNFLGWKEISANQVAVFAESYSGKEKKKDIYKYVFDKSDAKFTTTLLVSWPIESAMKSGTTKLEVSDNGRYIGFINWKDGAKKEAVSDDVVMMDGNASVTWKKQVAIDDKTYNRAFTVTNSGKAVLLRGAKGMKLSNALVVVSEGGQEDKSFGEEVMLHNPKAISIGQADYLIDFNYAAKGLRSGDYENLMLYDLSGGKILKNNKMADFNKIKDIHSIQFPKVFLQNNEIHLFVEPKVKAGTRQTKLNPMSSFTMEEPYYKFGPSYLIVMSFEGEIKSVRPIYGNYNSLADFYRSFGLVNISGKYYINADGLYNIYERPFDRSDTTRFPMLPDIMKDPHGTHQSIFVSQLVSYVRDAKKLIVARTYHDNKMSLISILGFPKE